MALFSDNTIICVLCRERIKNYNMTISYDNIGICKYCYEKLSPIPSGSAFDGKGNVDCVFPAFYYNDIMKSLIFRYKFNGEWKIGKLIAAMIYNNLKEVDYLHEFDFITPVPLSHKRFLHRGYNQSEIIARDISEMLQIPFETCVYRRKNTIAQSMLKRNDRIHNISNAFIADKDKVIKKNIILFDDIFTTGATLNACAGELKEKGAGRIIGISFATTSNHKK